MKAQLAPPMEKEGNLMELAGIRALFDQHERRDAEIVGATREATTGVVSYTIAPHRNGFILYQTLGGLDQAALDAVIQEQIAFFAGKAVTIEWKLYDHDTLPGLIERLLAHGFEAEDYVDTIMVLDLTAPLPAALTAPVTHDLRMLDSAAFLGDPLTVLNEAFSGDHTPHLKALVLEKQTAPDQLSLHVAYADGQPVSCGWVRFPRSPFASLWGGSTLLPYRGRGLYKAMLAIRVQEALQRGYSFAYVDAGDMSRPIVEKYGFRRLTAATSYYYRLPAQA
jgi:hypothetical protein